MSRTKVVVTDRDIKSNSVAETRAGLPDILLIPMGYTKRIVIRAAKTYVSSILGVLGYGVTSSLVPGLPYNEFTTNLLNASLMAVGPTVINILINLLILLTQLDESVPETMG